MFWVIKFLSCHHINCFNLSNNILTPVSLNSLLFYNRTLKTLYCSQLKNCFQNLVKVSSQLQIKELFPLSGVNSSSIYGEPWYAKLSSLLLMDRCPVSSATLAVFLCIVSTRGNGNCAHYCRWLFLQQR